MIKIGTDFSGIGSPEMALKYLGLEYKNVFACDVDKYAKQSYLALHDPETFYNDITTRNHSEVEKLDLYVAGFPCQSFSTAGQRKGFEETRGTLFFDTAKFIETNQPKMFVLENVKGLLNHDKGKTFQTIIDVLSNGGGTINGQMSLDVFEDGLGYNIYYKVLNTKDYGLPQNRERVFIIGFKKFREFTFPKPIELKKSLKDILENEVDEKFYLSSEIVEKYLKDSKSNSIDDIVIHCTHTRSNKRPSIKKNHNAGGTGHLSKSDGTTYCLDAQNSQAIEIRGGAIRKRENGPNVEMRIDNISNALTTITTDNIVQNDCIIRRLTPKETWRLQGFKDSDFDKVDNIVSNSQKYKQSGNSITINVMMSIFEKMFEISKII